MTGRSAGGPPLGRAALVVGGVLAAVCGLVWALGGFRPALGVGRPISVGENIQLRRWMITVAGAEYVDTSPSGAEIDPTVRIRLRLEFTGSKTVCCLTDGMITVRVGDQELVEASLPYEQVHGSLNFDPDVEAAMIFDYRWRPTGPPPPQVVVVVRDEEKRQNFLIGDLWRPTQPVALVATPSPDHRRRR